MATTPEIIEKTIDYVKETMIGESSGHDWWHAYRVWQMAKRIAIAEGADLLVVELAALLHDIADYKLNGGDTTIGPNTARVFLEQIAVSPDVVDHVCDIIATTSFQGAGVPTPMATKEGAIVQDADRLDAIGAIGIARTFAYGGHKGREMYDPNIQPVAHDSFDAYKNNRSPTINHFYEKLFLLKDLMNTDMARQIAEERHTYMKEYVDRFLTEWDGNS